MHYFYRPSGSKKLRWCGRGIELPTQGFSVPCSNELPRSEAVKLDIEMVLSGKVNKNIVVTTKQLWNLCCWFERFLQKMAKWQL